MIKLILPKNSLSAGMEYMILHDRRVTFCKCICLYKQDIFFTREHFMHACVQIFDIKIY